MGRPILQALNAQLALNDAEGLGCSPICADIAGSRCASASLRSHSVSACLREAIACKTKACTDLLT